MLHAQCFMHVQKLDTFGGHRDCVYALEAAQEPSTFFSSGADGLVVRWQLQRPDLGELIARIGASVYALSYDSAQKLLWVGQNYEGLHRIDPEQKLTTGSIRLTTAAIYDIKQHEQWLFVALGDGVVVVVDPVQLAVRKHLKASDKSARSIAINPLTSEFVVGYSDSMVRIFDLKTLALKQTIPAHTNSVFTVAFSPDFRYLVTAGRDAHLKIWSVADGYSLQQDIVAHMFAINHIAFSPDGRWFATASMDKSIKVWDATTYRLLKVVDRARHAGHGTSINRLLWDTQSNHLLSASDDRTISVWEVKNQH